MSGREQYAPGAASGAEVRKDGEKWTLVLVRVLPHNPENVWKALTDPEHLRELGGQDIRRSAHWTHRRPRGHEVRRLAAIERRVRKAVRR